MTSFTDATQRMREVHDAKSYDYAQEGNRYSNFETAAHLASQFPDGPDKVFATLMGVKLARLSELLTTQKTPKHESIEDTFLDLCNYGVLWWTWRSRTHLANQSTDADTYDWGV